MRKRIIAAAAASVLAFTGLTFTSATEAQAASCDTWRSGNTVTTACGQLKYSKVRAWADCWPNWRVYGPWVGSYGTSKTTCWTSVERYGAQYKAA